MSGSNNGTSWTAVNSQTNQVFSAPFQKNEYTLTGMASYLYYKLDITANNGATITQLSEWELVGSTCTPSTIVPYLSVNAGAWQQVSTASVAVGGSISLGPQPLDGTWSWAGPNGFTSALREIVITNIQASQGGNYIATYTNLTGCSSSVTFAITVGTTNVVTVYQDCDFTGYAIGLPVGSYTLAALQAKGITDNDISSLKITSGYKVTLYDGNTYTGTSLVKTGDVSCLVADNFNDLVTSIKIEKNTDSGDWSGFVPPSVDFTDEATSLEGSSILRNAIPDVTQMMKDQILLVCKELYANNSEKRPNFSSLHLLLQDDPTGVAAKWGDPISGIYIGISAQYLASFYHNNGNDLTLVSKEVRGILSHEGTHGYQAEPQNCGTYDGSSTFWGEIEGLADGVRGELTNWTPTRYPSKGGNWNSGYTTGGFFFMWCKHNKKATFIIELNRAARDMQTFTWEAAFQQVLGQSVQSVWDEYQNTL